LDLRRIYGYIGALDDFLGRKPVDYRVTQDVEIAIFQSYFKSVVYLNGARTCALSNWKWTLASSTPAMYCCSTSADGVPIQRAALGAAQ